MRFYEGLSQAEIAERTEIPLGTVKMRMVGALRRLRDLIQEEEASSSDASLDDVPRRLEELPREAWDRPVPPPPPWPAEATAPTRRRRGLVLGPLAAAAASLVLVRRRRGRRRAPLRRR